MPRRAKELTATQVERGTKPGRSGDGAGLYLVVAVPPHARRLTARIEINDTHESRQLFRSTKVLGDGWKKRLENCLQSTIPWVLSPPGMDSANRTELASDRLYLIKSGSSRSLP
jgi:hypothetical protein